MYNTMGALSFYNKVALVVCLFSFIYIMKPLVMAHIDSRVEERNLNEKPLFDMMHELLPNWRSHFIWIDNCMIVIMFITAVVCCAYNHIDTLLNVYIAFCLFTILKLILNAVTIHPDPSGICKEKKTFRGLAGQCNDLFPSGHMALLSALLIGLWPHMSSVVRGASVCAVAIMWLGILAVRNHYTIDTVASPLVMWVIWNIAGVRNL